MTPLSPELSAQIDRESKNDDINDDWDIAYAGGYKDAGTKYGAKWEQAKKALEEIRDYAESCNDMLNEASAGIIYKMATKALSTWKEEGRGGMRNKTHYAGCDRAHEGDNMDYWSEKTACGLDVDSDTLSVEDNIQYVDCKNCLKRLTTDKIIST